jgi:hypothetical protein
MKKDIIYGCGQDKTFEVIKEFVYLGSLVTPKNDVSLKLQKRIHARTIAFRDLDPLGPAVRHVC